MTIRVLSEFPPFFRAGVFLAALVLCLCVWTRFAYAQETYDQGIGKWGTKLILSEEYNRYDLSSFLYVTPDPEENLTYKSVLERQLSGFQRGYKPDSDLVNLGAGGVPHWVVLFVENRSWSEEWDLSFGSHFDGRLGTIKQIFVYDHLARKKYLDTVTSKTNTYVQTTAPAGTTLPVTIPKGKQALFIFYVVPNADIPTTLSFDLNLPEDKAESGLSFFRLDKLPLFFFMIIVGLFTGALIFRQAWISIPFLFYYSVQAALFFYNDAMFFSEESLASVIPFVLLGVSVFVGLLMAGPFLKIEYFHHAQNRGILFFSLFTVLFIAGAVFFVSSGDIIRPFLMIAPSVISMGFLVFLSLAQGYSGKTGAYFFALGWFVSLAGCLITILSLTGLFPPSHFLVMAYWYALFPQAFIFLAALFIHCMEEEKNKADSFFQSKEEEESLAWLRDNKEATENQRLRRLIAHERQVMNELRERELLQNEEMRQARDAADEANRAKSAFLAVISHEIRTPMTGIMGMVRLLLESSLTKNQKDYAQTIQESGDAMVALLNDILDFEKIESNSMALEHVDFDLHRLIKGTATLMTGHAAAKGIDLIVDIGTEVPAYVLGDPVRLRQVILNLMGNAIKFTAEGSVSIRVHTEEKDNDHQEVGVAKKVHRLRFILEDTGIGISPEAQKKLFDPFSQADTSITRKFGGTGLGLAISQRLVEAMGGQIQIDSTEGHGSIFFFTLVMEEGVADEGRDPADLLTSDKGSYTDTPEQVLHILVVEDNGITRKLLTEFVTRMGHEVKLAASGEEALDVIEQHEFDLVLMDVELPGMTGMGTTKAIRSLPDRERAAIPVIALTGNTGAEDIRRCYSANMNAHLEKPIDPDRLKFLIEKTVSGNPDNPVELPPVADLAMSAAIPSFSEDQPVDEVNITDEAQRLPEEHEDVPVSTEAHLPEMPPIVSSALNLEEVERPLEALEEDDKKQALEKTEDLNTEEDSQSLPDDVSFLSLEGDDGAAFSPLSRRSENEEPETAPVQDLALNMDGLSLSLEDDSGAPVLPASSEEAEDKGGAVSGQNQPVIFDAAMLLNLRQTMPTKDFQDMVDELFHKVDEITSALVTLPPHKDTDVVRHRVHEMKGMSGNFGLNEIAALADQMERAAKEGKMGDLPDLLDILPTAVNRARVSVHNWMDDESLEEE